MMNNLVMIKIKDICYYDDDFQYEPFIVEKDDEFEEKYNKLVEICKNYESFEEVEDFISENFEKISFETRYIGV